MNPGSGASKLVHSIPIIGDIAGFFGFEKGGRVPKTGRYVAHTGELVVPASTVRKYAKRKPAKMSGKGKGKGKVKGKVKPPKAKAKTTKHKGKWNFNK